MLRLFWYTLFSLFTITTTNHPDQLVRTDGLTTRYTSLSTCNIHLSLGDTKSFVLIPKISFSRIFIQCLAFFGPDPHVGDVPPSTCDDATDPTIRNHSPSDRTLFVRHLDETTDDRPRLRLQNLSQPWHHSRPIGPSRPTRTSRMLSRRAKLSFSPRASPRLLCRPLQSMQRCLSRLATWQMSQHTRPSSAARTNTSTSTATCCTSTTPANRL